MDPTPLTREPATDAPAGPAVKLQRLKEELAGLNRRILYLVIGAFAVFIACTVYAPLREGRRIGAPLPPLDIAFLLMLGVAVILMLIARGLNQRRMVLRSEVDALGGPGTWKTVGRR